MTARTRRGLGQAAAFALAAVALLLPAVASACPMCLSGQGGGTQKAFAIGSVFLSVTPLAVIGAAVWYLRRRARAIQHEDELARRGAALPASRPASPH
ncbi:MAG: hypothetical protein DCC71_03580 [Proteobacteria bacterium]|nr:MAG: hypothetical protein DCC71_03580 [Pseudomonadota bacterium]